MAALFHQTPKILFRKYVFHSNTLIILLLSGICLLSFNCKRNNNLLRSNIPFPRIISFAPSITETVYALGAQEHLVGVTDFCTYPPEATQLPRVGGYIDPNYEQILRLEADVAILLKEHGVLINFFEKHHIKVVRIDNENLAGILKSFTLIAEACGVAEHGNAMVTRVEKSLESSFPSLKRRPKILLSVGRDKPGSGTIGKVFMAGPHTFYSELINRAGGENAVTDSAFAYPSMAGEGIIHLAPDIIIDLMASNKAMDSGKVTADWKELGILPAVKYGTVFALTGKYVSIPGPRIVQIFNDLHRCIAEWDARVSLGGACLPLK